MRASVPLLGKRLRTRERVERALELEPRPPAELRRRKRHAVCVRDRPNGGSVRDGVVEGVRGGVCHFQSINGVTASTVTGQPLRTLSPAVAAQNTVMIVDDDPSIRLLCRLNLELDGFRALEAESLASARRLLDAEQVDVVLLDVHVGGENGVDFLDELKDSRPTLPVAMLTGDTTREGLVTKGADAVIGKPFTLDELKDTMTRLAGSSR